MALYIISQENIPVENFFLIFISFLPYQIKDNVVNIFHPVNAVLSLLLVLGKK